MRRAVAVLLTVVSAACATRDAVPGSSAAPPPVPPPAAELARSGLLVVREADAMLRDEARRRDLPVHSTYPDGKGSLPVIVFSPGAGGSGASFQPLARFWATRGYAVLALTHADGAGKKGGGAGLALREPAADAVVDPRGWENRVRDVVFVLDALDEVGTKTPELSGRLDATRVGVAGQSYGAFTAELLAGATVDIPKGEKAKSFADSRPRAFLLLSPPGKGQQGLTEKSWASVTRPLMVITGSRDRGVKGQDPAWRLDAYRLSPPGGKFSVWLEGASHRSFSGRAAEPGAALPRDKGKGAVSAEGEVALFQQVRIASLAFWDAFLRDDAGAKAFLDSDALAKESGGKAKLDRR